MFAAWTPETTTGIVSGHRIVGRVAWYWAALAREGRPLLHITDFEVPVRAADPFIVKGEALWAEHTRDAPMEQWSIGNETYASALDDPDDALGLAYGTPTPIAFDLEWYATGDAEPLSTPHATTPGYQQPGVVHGRIEILGEAPLDVAEIPAHRWHRWTEGTDPSEPMAPLSLPEAVAHTGVRAPFRFPDGSVGDWVLTPAGWHERRRPTGPS